jgi:hypothetical protein
MQTRWRILLRQTEQHRRQKPTVTTRPYQSSRAVVVQPAGPPLSASDPEADTDCLPFMSTRPRHLRPPTIEQIPILRYSVVDAATPSEDGASVAAACEKNCQTNPITWSVLNDLAFPWGAATRLVIGSAASRHVRAQTARATPLDDGGHPAAAARKAWWCASHRTSSPRVSRRLAAETLSNPRLARPPRASLAESWSVGRRGARTL